MSSASSAHQQAQNPNPMAKSSKIGIVTDRIHDEYTRGPDVWSTFNPAVFPDCVNLGQGFMNWAPPAFIRESLQELSDKRVDVHHYSHPKGRPRLRKAIADHLSEQYRKPSDPSQDLVAGGSSSLPKQRKDVGAQLDPETEVQITSGANGAIYCATTAFLEPGDEVIFISPHFDQYQCEVTFMGAKPVPIALLPPKEVRGSKGSDWKLDWEKIEEAMKSPKCKAIIFNTPHNPVGKVYDDEEISRLASLCIKYDLLCIADEVYDILTFDSKPHLRIASYEGMWNRTITISSAGKAFAATGWRIGWAVGPPHLIKPVLVVSTRISFSTNSIAAEAAAVGVEEAAQRGFYQSQIQEYEARRGQLCSALDTLGLPYTLPEGAYFIMVDASAIQIPEDYPFPEDVQKHYRTAYFVAKEAKVVCIPATAFVSEEHVPMFEKWLRLSFCKDEEGREGGELEKGGKQLQALKKYIKA